MDNQEKLATLGTQDEHKLSKNTPQYLLVAKKNVNKTLAPIQTLGGKKEPNFAFMRIS